MKFLLFFIIFLFNHIFVFSNTYNQIIDIESEYREIETELEQNQINEIEDIANKFKIILKGMTDIDLLMNEFDHMNGIYNELKNNKNEKYKDKLYKTAVLKKIQIIYLERINELLDIDDQNITNQNNYTNNINQESQENINQNNQEKNMDGNYIYFTTFQLVLIVAIILLSMFGFFVFMFYYFR
ncbi:hypothetical protein [Candidatus Vampirococcus lugosii]|uniref:Transmembrane protein n=1 Tax=Candidatus Vampirococcus lugosii TaxID=2789015 RepID=A0ABS5QLW2_9BACT|nr:hypothetical protein [Candidatus Vampirococcus lugosii]MBS8121763.1 hypothetical protein [Candidatus Vampirococcus lugosii]